MGLHPWVNMGMSNDFITMPKANTIDYIKRKQSKYNPLSKFFRQSPLKNMEIELTRDKDTAREIDL